jgi:pSer/pThr/pTyr-binding forkhead associated (FHA) protein
MELKLIVLAGAKQGLEIPLKKDKFLIGRAKECSLRAGSEAISRRHCAFVRKSGRWTVRDLGSRNGTYLNDTRISEEMPLSPGDEVRIGPLKFQVTAVGAAKTAAPPKPAAAEQKEPIKPRKQPPVKDVADVVERTISRSGNATEDDVSNWLLGLPEPNGQVDLKETRSLNMEETKSHSRLPAAGEASTAEEASEGANSVTQELAETPGDEAAGAETDSKSGGWSLFKRGKGAAKKKTGKLPPRPEQPTKDSREAAADILREMTRRR